MSVAEQVTMVLPIGNIDPEAGIQVTGTLPSTKSVAVGVVNVTVAPEELTAFAVIFEIGETTGAVVSTTITLNVVGVAVFPAVSVLLQVTVVVPRTNVDPETGEQLAGNVPSIASTALGAV